MTNIKITRFHATWCAPCHKYQAIFDDYIQDKDYEVEEYDVDQNLERVAENRVSMLPLTIIEGPKGTKRRTGVLDADALDKLIASVA